MASEKSTEQNETQLGDEALESVAGGIIEGGCTDLPPWIVPTLPEN